MVREKTQNTLRGGLQSGKASSRLLFFLPAIHTNISNKQPVICSRNTGLTWQMDKLVNDCSPHLPRLPPPALNSQLSLFGKCTKRTKKKGQHVHWMSLCSNKWSEEEREFRHENEWELSLVTKTGKTVCSHYHWPVTSLSGTRRCDDNGEMAGESWEESGSQDGGDDSMISNPLVRRRQKSHRVHR